MNKNREKSQKTGPLARGDERALSQLKKRVRISPVGKTLADRSGVSDPLFDNRIGLVTVEELAVIFGLAPQTIRNWVALGKIPYVKIGRRRFFQKRSLQEWLNRKEEPQWQ